MRETCNCGAEIRAISPFRISAWRKFHYHPFDLEPIEETEPSKNGAESRIEHSGPRYFEGSTSTPVVNARQIGF